MVKKQKRRNKAQKIESILKELEAKQHELAQKMLIKLK